MTPQERELIDGLFQRLKAADTPNKDREAEELINQRVADLPSVPYLLVQTVLVQEHALNAAQARIAQLEKELAALKAQAPASGGSTSFLGGLLGGRWNHGATASPQAAPAAPRTSVPVSGPAAGVPPAGGSYAPAYAPAAAAPASGGFLQSALTTAAGVAGGALLFEGLNGLLFHHPGPFSPYVGGGYGGSPWGGGENIYETNVYNYGNSDRPNDQGAIDTSTNDPSSDPGNDPNVQDASYDPSDDAGNYDDNSGGDFGGDFGGGNDDTSV